MTPRIFTDNPAKREKVPLLVGIVGPSGVGKTYSALRLASGMKRASGGDIYVIDTESRRALHYADNFDFRHVEFGAPFGPLDYLAAIEHCVKKGAGTIIIDSLSHLHEGPGGILEMHDKAMEGKDQRYTLSAWIKPKAELRRMINTILQLPINLICCFRAKEKMKIENGKDPEQRGWQPIASTELTYEMTVNLLLMPGACGAPSLWQKDMTRDENAMVKVPSQFLAMFKEPRQLDERHGEELAKWAQGGSSGVIAEDEAFDLEARLVLVKGDVAKFLGVAGVKSFADIPTGKLAKLQAMLATKEKAMKPAGEISPEEAERIRQREAAGQ